MKNKDAQPKQLQLKGYPHQSIHGKIYLLFGSMETMISYQYNLEIYINISLTKTPLKK
jgi:hypothetical protein